MSDNQDYSEKRAKNKQKKKGIKQKELNVRDFLDVDASEDDQEDELSEQFSDEDEPEINTVNKGRLFDRDTTKHQPGFLKIDNEKELIQYFEEHESVLIIKYARMLI